MLDLSADAYSAIATAAAAVIALGIAVVDQWRRRRDQKDAEMAQARLVHAVQNGLHLSLFNDSQLPIYDARFIRIRRSNQEPSIGVATEDFDRVVAGDDVHTTVQYSKWDGSGSVQRGRGVDEVSGAFQFMDASGLFWERDLGDRESSPRRVRGANRAGTRIQRITTRHGL